jgi:hypothetical protein
MLWVEFHVKFVVAAADVLDEGVSSTDHAGRTEPFEATHGPESRFKSSMIGLDRIIPILLHDMARERHQLIEHPRRHCCIKGAAHQSWSTWPPRNHAAGLQMPGL